MKIACSKYENSTPNVINIKLIEEKEMTLEEIKEQIAKLNEVVSKMEAEKESENVFDKYGRLIEAKKDGEFYVVCANGEIAKQIIPKNYCKENQFCSFFKDFKSAEFALKLEMRNNILRKHGAEFPIEGNQYFIDGTCCVSAYCYVGLKTFTQQYFKTEEQAESAKKELQENNLLKIEME